MAKRRKRGRRRLPGPELEEFGQLSMADAPPSPEEIDQLLAEKRELLGQMPRSPEDAASAVAAAKRKAGMDRMRAEMPARERVEYMLANTGQVGGGGPGQRGRAPAGIMTESGQRQLRDWLSFEAEDRGPAIGEAVPSLHGAPYPEERSEESLRWRPRRRRAGRKKR